jgi:plastocyanin
MVVTLEGREIIGQSLVKPVMKLEDMRFVPAVLPVAPHAKVTFENRHQLAHQLEPVGNKWFAGQRLEKKASFSHVFDTPGSYQLRCAEYPHMRATVLVIGAPIFVLPDANGAFVFPEMRPGSYTLKVWYREQWIHSQEVTVKPQPKLVEVSLVGLGGD